MVPRRERRVEKRRWYSFEPKDGSSVNFGHISGLMKRMENGSDWLISFHCVNHQDELSFKDSFKMSKFNTVDGLYTGICNLLKKTLAR